MVRGIFIDSKDMQGYISTIMIGCLAAAIFMIAFWLAMQSKERFGLSEPLSEQTALVIAAIAIMPLWLPLLWKRLARLKLGPLEFDLSEFGVKGSLALAEELVNVKSLPMGPSSIVPLVKKISNAISEAETSQVVEIHFGVGKLPWWSTRLYLLASLAKEYTGIIQFIFLEGSHDRDRLFVGSATPAAILQFLNLDNPELKEAYQKSKKEVREKKMNEGELAWIDQNLVDQFKNEGAEEEKERQILLAQIALAFVNQFKSEGGEEKAKEIVNRQFLQRCLPMIEGIEWHGGPSKTWLIYQIVSRYESFVSLIKPNGQLDIIVDRMKLAQQVAKASLRMQLDHC